MDYELEILNLKRRIEELEKVILKNEENAIHSSKSIQSSARDKTKYMFDGKVYAKNRLVLAIIKEYVEQNNPTFAQLSSVFDKSLQGSLGVVKLYADAKAVSDSAKRFFMKDEDVILLSDAKVVVCTQWGIFNITKFIKQAKALGFAVEII